jgi:hypothetical protein
MSTISIEVDPESARAFAAASDADRRKLELLLNLRLRELTAVPSRSLSEIMDDVGRNAAAKGLTPELLDSMLHGK